MSTRAELEAALQKAEAAWSAANGQWDMAQAARIKANANWDQLITDRRKAKTDRRRPSTVWNAPFPDRRVATTDQRKRDDGVAAFVKTVAGQHDTYIARSKAEADWAAAKTSLDTASAERDRAIVALDVLDRAGRVAE